MVIHGTSCSGLSPKKHATRVNSVCPARRTCAPKRSRLPEPCGGQVSAQARETLYAMLRQLRRDVQRALEGFHMASRVCYDRGIPAGRESPD